MVQFSFEHGMFHQHSQIVHYIEALGRAQSRFFGKFMAAAAARPARPTDVEQGRAYICRPRGLVLVWLLVPKLCLGTQIRETRFARTDSKQSFEELRSQTEFGNEKFRTGRLRNPAPLISSIPASAAAPVPVT
jgi:hypothetical protein